MSAYLTTKPGEHSGLRQHRLSVLFTALGSCPALLRTPLRPDQRSLHLRGPRRCQALRRGRSTERLPIYKGVHLPSAAFDNELCLFISERDRTKNKQQLFAQNANIAPTTRICAARAIRRPNQSRRCNAFWSDLTGRRNALNVSTANTEYLPGISAIE